MCELADADDQVMMVTLYLRSGHDKDTVDQLGEIKIFFLQIYFS